MVESSLLLPLFMVQGQRIVPKLKLFRVMLGPCSNRFDSFEIKATVYVIFIRKTSVRPGYLLLILYPECV